MTTTTPTTKILISYHNSSTSEERRKAKKQAEAFLHYLTSVGEEEVTEIAVTWTPDGTIGGFLVKRLPPKKSEMDKENLDPLHKEAKLLSKTAIKPKRKLPKDQQQPKRRNSNPIKIKIKFH